MELQQQSFNTNNLTYDECSDSGMSFLLNFFAGTMEEAPQLKLKEEKTDSFETGPRLPSSVTCPSVMDTAVPSPNHAAECASPPSSSLPFVPVVIKEEPQSPVHVSSELDAVDSITHCAHSTTPELPVAPVTASPGNFIKCRIGQSLVVLLLPKGSNLTAVTDELILRNVECDFKTLQG